MTRRELGRLADRAAEVAQSGGMAAAAALSRLLREEGARHHLSEFELTALIAEEWARTGVVTLPGFVQVPGVPRGTLQA